LVFTMNARHQTCKACGKRDKFDFHVPDEVWHAALPAHLHNRVVCLACFDGFAHERGVAYATSLTELCFAGERSALLFKVIAAVD
jgi:hypothetical protein